MGFRHLDGLEATHRGIVLQFAMPPHFLIIGSWN